MKVFLVNFYKQTRLSILLFIGFNIVLYFYLSRDIIIEKIIYSILSIICYIMIKEFFRNNFALSIDNILSGIKYEFPDSTSADLDKIYNYTKNIMNRTIKKSEDVFVYSVLLVDLTSIVKYGSFIVISAVGIIITIFLGKFYKDD